MCLDETEPKSDRHRSHGRCPWWPGQCFWVRGSQVSHKVMHWTVFNILILKFDLGHILSNPSLFSLEPKTKHCFLGHKKSTSKTSRRLQCFSAFPAPLAPRCVSHRCEMRPKPTWDFLPQPPNRQLVDGWDSPWAVTTNNVNNFHEKGDK